MEYIEKTLTGVYDVGSTSITFTDNFINNNSIIDIYFNNPNVSPSEQLQNGNTVTVVIPQQTVAVGIAIHITNYDTIDYSENIDDLESEVINIQEDVADLFTFANATTETLENLQTGKQDTLTAGNNISIVNNVISSSGGSSAEDIFFDNSETTLQSQNVQNAIVEVFQSVSNGKTLVAGAITDKGVATSATDSFATMAENIGKIETGGTTKKYQYGFVVLNHPLSYYGINASEHCIIFYNNTYNFIICELKTNINYLTISSNAIELANKCKSRYNAQYNDITHELTNVTSVGAPTSNITYTGILYFNNSLGGVAIGSRYSIFEREI